jgi:hypothetical protein
MNSQPPVEFFSYGISGPQWIPLPQGAWSWISTAWQADQILQCVKVFCPDAVLVDGSQFVGNGGGSLMFPNPNPNGYGMWQVNGGFKTPGGLPLTVDSLCGGLFDEGPAQVITLPGGAKVGPFGGEPSIWTDRNPDSSLGGTFLDYGDMEDVGGPDAYLHWASAPQGPVSLKRLMRTFGPNGKKLTWVKARSSGVYKPPASPVIQTGQANASPVKPLSPFV